MRANLRKDWLSFLFWALRCLFGTVSLTLLAGYNAFVQEASYDY